MGSGETSPTMVKVHRSLVNRLGGNKIKAVVLDTPYGFQENAAELSAKAVAYFDESIDTSMKVASYKSSTELSAVAHNDSLALLRSADYIFAGPGSPGYALRQWRQSIIPAILKDKLTSHCAITFASAAAVTLGAYSAPIYEIYKVGEDPHWLEGLNLVEYATGLRCAIVPHYDNSEGGTHDTRFCYLGERRLSSMEGLLDDNCFILGIDEHTGCIFDLENATIEVVGRGCVTVRKNGNSIPIETSAIFPISHIHELVSDLCSNNPSSIGLHYSHNDISNLPLSSNDNLPSENKGFLDQVRDFESEFKSAISLRDLDGALASALELGRLIADWSNETFSSSERELANQAYREMLIEFSHLAKLGLRDPQELFGPLVTLVIRERDLARREKRYKDSDRLRSGLESAGIEVRDTPSGTEWMVRQEGQDLGA